MTIQTATPYLILNGKADRAIALYERALGAKTESLQRFGDADANCPAAKRDLVMHALLRFGETRIMLSDGAGEGEGPAPSGGPVSVALALDDAAESKRVFEQLAEGGTVVQPLFESPWGSLFGVVVDPFGVSWMFDCSKPKG